ncbi:MAG: hypothetical protein HY332_02610 [Chloroflexi bacterium]|nr:hypothetical protein [Chloroflexota bacterium]
MPLGNAAVPPLAIKAMEAGAHVWVEKPPADTLAQAEMYNKNIFLIDYVGEVSHFAESVLADRPPECASAADLLEIMRWTEALHGPSGTLTRINAPAEAAVVPSRAAPPPAVLGQAHDDDELPLRVNAPI